MEKQTSGKFAMNYTPQTFIEALIRARKGEWKNTRDAWYGASTGSVELVDCTDTVSAKLYCGVIEVAAALISFPNGAPEMRVTYTDFVPQWTTREKIPQMVIKDLTLPGLEFKLVEQRIEAPLKA